MRGKIQKQIHDLLLNGAKKTMEELKAESGLKELQVSRAINSLRQCGCDIVCEPTYRMEKSRYEQAESATDKVYDYLQKYGSINIEEAEDKLHIDHLGACITNLIRKGVAIKKDWEKGQRTDGKKTILIRYRLEGWKEESVDWDSLIVAVPEEEQAMFATDNALQLETEKLKERLKETENQAKEWERRCETLIERIEAICGVVTALERDDSKGYKVAIVIKDTVQEIKQEYMVALGA